MRSSPRRRPVPATEGAIEGALALVAALLAAPPAAASWASTSWADVLGAASDALAAPELRPEILSNGAFCAGALGLIVLGLAVRRFLALVPVALVFMAWRLVMLGGLLAAEPAAPPLSAAAVASGARLFAERCAACHGADRRGGPVLQTSPQFAGADLTGAHIYGHSPAALSRIIAAGDPGTPMQGFPDLDVAQRWTLVAYILAGADGARLSGSVPGPPPRLAPAPDFDLACPSGETRLSQLRGRLVLVGFAAAGSRPEMTGMLRRLAEDPGLRPVLVPLENSAPEPGLCVARDPAAVAAYALYREGGALDGAAMVIDTAGGLRAVLRPGDGILALDPLQLRLAVEAICAVPMPAAARGTMPHHGAMP